MFRIVPVLILILTPHLGVTQDSVILKPNQNGCIYLEYPTYIINEEYVVFLSCKTRKIIYPDIKTFEVYGGYRSEFAMDKNGIFFMGELITNDTGKFELLGKSRNIDREYLWRINNRVFKNNKGLTGIDVSTFQAVGNNYFKDKNYVYYFDKRIKNSHGPSAGEPYGNIFYDKNNVYIEGEIVFYKQQKCFPVNSALYKTNTDVIYKNAIIKSMDAHTLKGLSRNYSMDKYHVYFDTSIVPIKPADFKNIKVWDHTNSAYISDGKFIYGGSNKTKEIFNVATFGTIQRSDLCYDKNGIYEWRWNESKEMSERHTLPFTYSTPVTAKNTFKTEDCRFIIYDHQAYDESNKQLFETITDDQLKNARAGLPFLTKDNELSDKKIAIAGHFFKVGNKIVTYEVEVKNIDAASFKYLFGPYVKDKNGLYYFHIDSCIKLENIDSASFDNFMGFGKDKDNLYLGSDKLIGSKNLELLAIYSGYRRGCSQDRRPGFDYYFFKNTEGFWLFETTQKNATYLGTTFNPKWNKVFEGFEMPVK